MKFYDVDSEFTFGKYEGKTIKEVFEKDPKYIDFCYNNIDEFYVSPSVLKELKATGSMPSPSAEDDDVMDSFFEDAEEVDDFEPEIDEDEDFDWDDDDLNLIDDDDYDNFDDFDDDDF